MSQGNESFFASFPYLFLVVRVGVATVVMMMMLLLMIVVLMMMMMMMMMVMMMMVLLMMMTMVMIIGGGLLLPNLEVTPTPRRQQHLMLITGVVLV